MPNLDYKAFLNNTSPLNQDDYRQLVELIRFHEHRYYIENDPLISDFEYDSLFKILERTEELHPEWRDDSSPSSEIYPDLLSRLGLFDHLIPMLSLANTYNIEDLKDFDKRIKKLCSVPEDQALEYIVEPKFDGGSMAVVYENDQLVRAATRGDGIKGEDMTANAMTIKSLPQVAPFSKHRIYIAELRGEALIRKDNFIKLNKDREQNGLPLLANPRNAATGVMRAKDPNETASRNLDLFIYQISFANDPLLKNKIPEYKTQLNLINLAQELGFKVPTIEKKLCKGIDQVFEFIQTWVEKRDQYDYELDGMVIKLNSLEMQEQCGYTSHHPRWAVAFKFQAKQATSVLRQVEFQVGKIGSITPVAKIDPVALAGVTVSSISLHNEDFIKSRDIHIGDSVLVERAGDVIPYIVKVFPENRPIDAYPVAFPINCPSCATTLVRELDEAAWRCPNIHCPAQIVQKLIHHVSKDAMDIDGLGASLVERFFNLGIITNMADIYHLDYEQISKLEGLGSKSVDNLKYAIDIAKGNPIHRVLHGLCIHHLGKKISKLIAEHLSYLPDLKNWTIENFKQIKDVGPVVGENIIQYFQDSENYKIILEMEKHGVNMLQTEEDRPRQVSSDAPLSGKTILFTGSLSMDRKRAQELAEKAGAKNISAVSGNLNILVVGADAGSKLEKAKKLNTVEIWTEEEFLQKIDQN